MNPPFFTVIIPTYNRATLLREAMQSVIDQTFKDYELIVVDDYSTDNSKEVINSFSDKRIRHIVNDRKKGPAGARNAGIFRARGEWVAFLDDDDLWLPEKLQLQHREIQGVGKDVGLIYTGYVYYDLNKKRIMSEHVPQKEGWIENDLLYRNYIGALPTVAVRADLLKKICGFDERFHFFEDGDLFVRIAKLSQVVFIKDPLALIRLSNGNARLSANMRSRVEGYNLFLEKHEEDIKKYPRLRHRIMSRIFVFSLLTADLAGVLKAFPWTCAGIVLDLRNFFWTFQTVLLSLYRKLRYRILQCFGKNHADTV